MFVFRYIVCALLLVSAVTAFASDPVSELQRKIDAGEVTLEFDDKVGYLESLLKQLHVSVSSQTLVFSKTSLQSQHISPGTPRALYFNDNVYLAWVPDTSFIEIMSVDPAHGAIFYLLDQNGNEQPGFSRSTGHECSVCHHAAGFSSFVPRLLFTSVVPDISGSVEGTFPIPTTDQSPFEERWGGWYVTGTHGDQRHLGNVVLERPASVFGGISGVDFSRFSNVLDLSDRFDTTRYPAGHSDIVALMVLAHQVEVHNLIALANARPDAPEEAGEPLVRAMLFAGAAPLRPVQGTSNFAAEFAGQGPRDSRGRSLRDLDLETRLFRYPMSYMVYAKPFDEMDQAVRTYVYGRLREVLTGGDSSPDFTHLSAADRRAILEILGETKPDFGSWAPAQSEDEAAANSAGLAGMTWPAAALLATVFGLGLIIFVRRAQQGRLIR